MTGREQEWEFAPTGDRQKDILLLLQRGETLLEALHGPSQEADQLQILRDGVHDVKELLYHREVAWLTNDDHRLFDYQSELHELGAEFIAANEATSNSMPPAHLALFHARLCNAKNAFVEAMTLAVFDKCVSKVGVARGVFSEEIWQPVKNLPMYESFRLLAEESVAICEGELRELRNHFRSANHVDLQDICPPTGNHNIFLMRQTTAMNEAPRLRDTFVRNTAHVAGACEGYLKHLHTLHEHALENRGTIPREDYYEYQERLGLGASSNPDFCSQVKKRKRQPPDTPEYDESMDRTVKTNLVRLGPEDARRQRELSQQLKEFIRVQKERNVSDRRQFVYDRERARLQLEALQLEVLERKDSGVLPDKHHALRQDKEQARLAIWLRDLDARIRRMDAQHEQGENYPPPLDK